MTEHDLPADAGEKDDAQFDEAELDAEQRESTTDIAGKLEAAVRTLLAEQSTFVGENTAEGAQTYIPDIKDRIALAKQDLTAEQKRHDLEQTAKDNEQRREQEGKDNDQRRSQEWWTFRVAMTVACVLLFVGLLSGLLLDTSDAKASWGRSIVTAILGAYAGYLTGRAGKSK